MRLAGESVAETPDARQGSYHVNYRRWGAAVASGVKTVPGQPI